MNIVKFWKSRMIATQNGTLPFNEGKIDTTLIVSLSQYAAPEHELKTTRKGMSELTECFCGWKSKSCFDSWSEALNQWIEHTTDAMGIDYKPCPCGKLYLPSDGGKPCHELRALGKRDPRDKGYLPDDGMDK